MQQFHSKMKNTELSDKGNLAERQGYPPMGTPQNFKISAYADDIEGTHRGSWVRVWIWCAIMDT
mgnify:CR=1 FL=1